MRAFASLVLAGSFWTWLQRLGGPGLILLGLLDNSAIPLPGSMDLLVILLSAHHRQWWPYYALMATRWRGHWRLSHLPTGGEGWRRDSREEGRQATRGEGLSPLQEAWLRHRSRGSDAAAAFSNRSVSSRRRRAEISPQELSFRVRSRQSSPIHCRRVSGASIRQRNHRLGVALLPTTALYADHPGSAWRDCRSRVLQMVSAQTREAAKTSRLSDTNA